MLSLPSISTIWRQTLCFRLLAQLSITGRDIHQFRLKGTLHPLGVGCGQRVLFTQALVRPRCRVVTGAKINKFGDQSIA